jgi:CBS domain-containing protein
VLPLPKIPFEPHALGDIEQPLANGNLVCYINGKSLPPMETVLSILAFILACTIIAIPFGVIQGSQTWAMEDPPYVNVNLRIRPVREVDRKQPTPLQTTDSAVTVGKKPEKAAVPDDLDKTKLVRSVMVKTPYYCRENQSDEEALEMMRELDLPCLPVLDSNLRVVGMVRLIDLMRSKEQKDPPPSGK